VLVRRVAFDGKHKLADTYEDDIYSVVCQTNPDVPVYRVRSGDKEKVLHRNLLYLVDHQDLDEDSEDTDDETDEDTRKEVSTVKKSDVTNDQDDSDSDDGLVVVTGRDGDAYHMDEESQEVEICPSVEDDPEEIARVEPEETPEDIDRDLVVTVEETPEEDEEDIEAIDITEANADVTHPEEDAGDVEDEDAVESDVQHTEADIPADVPAERGDMRPVPPPRRTTRVSRPPDRYGNNVMMANVPRPINRKLDAVSALMTSGALNSMDSETVDKVFAAIFK